MREQAARQKPHGLTEGRRRGASDEAKARTLWRWLHRIRSFWATTVLPAPMAHKFHKGGFKLTERVGGRATSSLHVRQRTQDLLERILM